MISYTFEVTLPGYDGLWRRIELRDDQTLNMLHLAIQAVFEFDAAHLYSFFMSGEPWDSASEYAAPEDADDDELWEEPSGNGALPEETLQEIDRWVEEALQEDEEELDEELLDRLQGLSPQELRDFIEQSFDLLQEQGGMSDEEMEDWRNLSEGEREMFLNWVQRDVENMLAGGPEAGNALTTRLRDLNLQVGQSFLYLFDYGDEWHFRVELVATDPAAPPGDYPRLVGAAGEAPDQYGWDEEEWEEDDGE